MKTPIPVWLQPLKQSKGMTALLAADTDSAMMIANKWLMRVQEIVRELR